MDEEIVRLVREAGVVGEGGAGFPTHIKLASSVDVLIANGCECEPLLALDTSLITHHPEEVVRGLEIASKATGAHRVIMAIKTKRHQAIDAIRPLVEEKGWEMFLTSDVYPAGDEHVLVWETTGRVVPPGGIPLEVGVVVQNVGTLSSISLAMGKKPVITKRVTITGAVYSPATFTLPLGTSFSQAISLAGGATCQEPVVIEGGPMTGKLIDDLEKSVVKTTSGIIVLPRNHPLVRQRFNSQRSSLFRSRTCIQCFYCTLTCPRYLLGHPLEPHLLMRNVSYGMVSSQLAETASLCSECNLCELYSCPAGVFPRGVNVYIKGELSRHKKIYKRPSREWKPIPNRDGRLVPTKRLIYRLGLSSFPEEVEESNEKVYPSRVCLPLKQHIGIPAVPVKKIGDLVKRGEVIADIPPDAVGARLHASISGRVVAIGESMVIESGDRE